MRFDHLIDWNNLKILKIEAHYSKRLTSEASQQIKLGKNNPKKKEKLGSQIWALTLRTPV